MVRYAKEIKNLNSFLGNFGVNFILFLFSGCSTRIEQKILSIKSPMAIKKPQERKHRTLPTECQTSKSAILTYVKKYQCGSFEDMLSFGIIRFVSVDYFFILDTPMIYIRV